MEGRTDEGEGHDDGEGCRRKMSWAMEDRAWNSRRRGSVKRRENGTGGDGIRYPEEGRAARRRNIMMSRARVDVEASRRGF